METTKLSSKGQVVLPASVRKARQWKPGTELVVENRPEGVLLRAAKLFPETTLDEVVGSAKYHGPPISIREMDEAVLREARRQRFPRKR
jgi:AbrB family looped-hinge helix DNA binding protein